MKSGALTRNHHHHHHHHQPHDHSFFYILTTEARTATTTDVTVPETVQRIGLVLIVFILFVSIPILALYDRGIADRDTVTTVTVAENRYNATPRAPVSTASKDRATKAASYTHTSVQSSENNYAMHSGTMYAITVSYMACASALIAILLLGLLILCFKKVLTTLKQKRHPFGRSVSLVDMNKTSL